MLLPTLQTHPITSEGAYLNIYINITKMTFSVVTIASGISSRLKKTIRQICTVSITRNFNHKWIEQQNFMLSTNLALWKKANTLKEFIYCSTKCLWIISFLRRSLCWFYLLGADLNVGPLPVCSVPRQQHMTWHISWFDEAAANWNKRHRRVNQLIINALGSVLHAHIHK